MHTSTLQNWQHSHPFALNNESGERRTRLVLFLTLLTMTAEIIAGTVFGSMALLADGWHMGTHAAAFLIAVFAYRHVRKHQHSLRYAFGAGKVEVLAGFASAAALAVVALLMLAESLARLAAPAAIRFDEAIAVAVIGFAVNLISAFLLKDGHHHHERSHSHDHSCGHEHRHHDHNLRAAYLHVLADALTSVLAITALLAGKFFGWHWLDPLMGIVGAAIITAWAWGLIQETAPILLDSSIDQEQRQAIQAAVEQDADNRVSDMHVWKAGANHYAAIIAVVTHYPKPPEHYKELLRQFHSLSHVTVEVNACKGPPCIPEKSKA
uniref:CDF family Co(II)/Ni(II) efflux transporter DmeF n=1 Tax=Candidatus Electronema sp. TaxID=2698783 RepID=UPI004056FF6D